LAKKIIERRLHGVEGSRAAFDETSERGRDHDISASGAVV
jgi:hypothetical protein